MSYYLKWSDSTGDITTNNELLQISGVSGTLVSIEYVVKAASQVYTINRYLFDIRRLVGSDTNGGDRGWIINSAGDNTITETVSNFRKNGISINALGLFENYAIDDTFSFDVGIAPSGGAFSFGARYNEIEHFYGLSVSSIIVEDSDGLHTIDMSDSGGSGTSLTSTDGDITATLFNFPTDDSQWVFYSTGPDTPVNLSITNLLATTARLNWEQG